MTKILCRCGNNLGTIAVVASMEGANWDKLDGGPALHVVVNAQEAHVTNYTMYGLITSTFDGAHCVRWNMARVAGCTVGPMRTVAAMRQAPWLLAIGNVADSKIHAVMLCALPDKPTRVALVDGVCRTGSGDWQLVGIEMVVSEHSGGVADKLLPLVSWPATTSVGGIAAAPVKPLPWAEVTHPAILIAHSIGDVDAAPAERQFGLVDPGTSFAMIPITIGRMRAQEDSLVRVLELNSVADISAQIGTREDVGGDGTTGFDEVSAPAEFLASVESIKGALAEAHLEDVYESLCWLGTWRPESNTYLNDFRRVSRGLLPAGCLQFTTAVAKFRGYHTTGYCDMPPGIRVLDIGSGDGVVVLSLGAIGARAGWEVRGIELPCKPTCKHDACPLGAWHRWVGTIYDTHPLLHSIAEAACDLVVIADATSEADEVARLWGWADVIFMNNLCFDSETVDAIKGTKVTTMSKMVHSLCAHGRIQQPPTLVITTCAIHLRARTASHAPNQRNEPYRQGTKQVRQLGTFHMPPNGYDWGKDGATLECFVHALEAADAESVV